MNEYISWLDYCYRLLEIIIYKVTSIQNNRQNVIKNVNNVSCYKGSDYTNDNSS